MSDQPKSKDRIPKESLNDSSSVASWTLPSMNAGDQVVRSAKRKNEGSTGDKIEIEKVSVNKKPRQLTAEELHQITEDARKEGFQQGLHEGTEQGIREGTKAGEKAGNQRAYLEAKKEIEALQNQLRGIINRIYDPMQQQDAQLENILVDLVLGLTKSVVGSEINTKPQIILDIVESTLQSLPKGVSNIRISLSIKDAELVETLIPESQRDWKIIADNKLSSGGCIVETESSLVDFSIEQRLATFLEKIASNSTQECNEDIPDYHTLSQQTENECEENESASGNSNTELDNSETDDTFLNKNTGNTSTEKDIES